MNVKRKWPIVLAVILLAAATGIFCFRDALMIRLFPKVVLSNALGESFSQLEIRYADSPAHILAKAISKDGCQNITMKLDTSTKFMGIAHYDLQLHTQTHPNRIYGDGSVSTGAGIMDLQLYLDEHFGAVSSRSLTEGAYYGLTYDTFPADIRSFDMLRIFAGEAVLTGWDDSVSRFAEFMRRNYTFPELSAQDVRSALMAALALKPQVEAGESPDCYTVTFRADGTEIGLEAEPYIDQLPGDLASFVQQLSEDEHSQLQVVFSLHEKQLNSVEAVLTLSNGSYRAAADLTHANTLVLELFAYDGENLDRTELAVKTLSDAEVYQEFITITRTVNGVRSQTTADYTWDLSSGDMAMELIKDEKKYPIRLNLTGEGESFTISCQKFETILNLIAGQENPRPAICVLTVSPGEHNPEIPEYRNLSDWSMEDLLLLLTRLGGLVGLKLP